MKALLLLALLSVSAYAGLPPTTSKVTGDASDITTFKYQFPNFTGTHTGTTISLGVNSVAGGGTGQSSLTSGNIIIGNGSSAVTFLSPSVAGTVPVANGSTWGAGALFVSYGPLTWIESTNAAIPSVDAGNERIYSFQSGLGQAIYASVYTPLGYTAGSQISLRFSFYSPDSSGNALMQCVSTLVRPSFDTFNATTNQRTSTNGAVTLGAGTVNKPQSVTCDLTDSTGHVNGQAVAGNQIITVKLTRGTDTATSDVAVPIYSTEVAFQ